jgi:hypothetical protein
MRAIVVWRGEVEAGMAAGFGLRVRKGVRYFTSVRGAACRRKRKVAFAGGAWCEGRAVSM